MNCPFCNSSETFVKDTRWNIKQERRRRRYECKKCLNRFSTLEDYTDEFIFVKKELMENNDMKFHPEA